MTAARDQPVFEGVLKPRSRRAVAVLLDLAVLAGLVYIAVAWLRDLGQGGWIDFALRLAFLLAMAGFLFKRSAGLLARFQGQAAPRAVLRIGPEGLVIPVHGEPPVRIGWAQVRSFEIADQRAQSFVNHGPDAARRSTELPLRLLDDGSATKALEVIRAYWPDALEPWQQQSARRKP